MIKDKEMDPVKVKNQFNTLKESLTLKDCLISEKE